MPLVLTPRHLTQRAELYQQLASLTVAGVGLISAAEMLRDSPPSRALRRPLAHLVQQLNDGAGFSEALATLGRGWLPAFDVALIEAGQNSGRLDVCFRFLSEYYSERARLARQVISELTYPVFILHFAILIFPTTLLTRLVWQGDVIGFVLQKAAILGPLYLGAFLLLYLGQAGHSERWRAWLEFGLRCVPVLGAARTNLALARLSVALESLLNAGVSIIEAWELAAAASGSPALRRTVFAWRSSVQGGQTPAEAVRASRVFPDLFTNLYSTGEISGQLDDTLRRLYRHYQEEALRKLHIFAQWAPRLIYLLVMLLIAYQVVSFWAGYYSQISNLAQ
jgi:type II secretory pathway component PulF